jgi:hypothetical protein
MFVLDETQIPKFWYNLMADLPAPLLPLLRPGHQEAGSADLEPLFYGAGRTAQCRRLSSRPALLALPIPL